MPVYKDKLKKDQSTAWYFKTSINGRSFLRRGFKSKKEAIQA